MEKEVYNMKIKKEEMQKFGLYLSEKIINAVNIIKMFSWHLLFLPQ